MKTVWPIKSPPVSTAFWNDADWEKYAEAFRPADYDGGQFDSDAWLAYKAKRLNDMREELGMPTTYYSQPTPMENFLYHDEHSEYL